MAITILESLGNENAASTGGSVVMTQNPTVGQPIVVTCPYTNFANILSITDNVGNTYTKVATFATSINGAAIYWAIAQSTSPPTVTIAMNGTRAWKMEVTTLQGFQGTPTLDFGGTNTFAQQWTSASGTSVDFSPITSSFNNEILFMSCDSDYDLQAYPTGWNTTAAPPYNYDSFYQICNSAGTSADFVGTIPSSGAFYGLLVGVYDFVATDVLVGQTTPTTGGNQANIGQNLQWQTFTASASGNATSLCIYLQNVNLATTLWLGVYNSAGNLLGSGSLTPLAGLNQVSLASAVPIVKGQQYSLAWITDASNHYVVVANDNGTTPVWYESSNATSGQPPPGTLPASIAHNDGSVTIFALGGLGLSAQTITDSIGTIGVQPNYKLTALSGSFVEGSVSPDTALTLAASTVPNVPVVGSTTPTSGGNQVAVGGDLNWYSFTASESGTVTALNAYVYFPLAVKTLYLALYDVNGNLLTTGSGTPVAGLNTFSASPVSITAGQTYSIAFITVGGNGIILVNDGSNTSFSASSSVVGVPPPATLPAAGSTSNVIGQATLFASGTVPGPNTAQFFQGSILNAKTLSGQTLTSSEGSLTATIQQGSFTYALGAQALTAALGNPQWNVSYLLDQGAVTFSLVGQTLSSSQGAMTLVSGYQLSIESVTSTLGTISSSPAVSLANLNLASAEGLIVAVNGNSVTAQLTPQVLSSLEGGIASFPGYALTSVSASFTEGTITFSSVQNTINLSAQQATFALGGIVASVTSYGTGPPLFIPPQLGKPVTTRTFSWLEMASRAWGSEFRAPDHRIYQFSGGNYKDSTDMGTTGIYSPNLGTPDNP